MRLAVPHLTLRGRLILANVIALVVLGAMLWSQLPPGTPVTDAAIEHVRREVEYAERIAPDLPHEYVVALAVNNYVVGHISAPMRGYRVTAPLPTAPTWPVEAVVEDAFAEGSGICGAATLTALALYEALGVEARRIEVWYTEPTGREVGHVTTEVRYGGAWHWFDPTWGAFFRDAEVYSLAEVVRMSPDQQAETLVANDTLLWGQVVDEVGDPGMAFVSYAPLRVELAGRVIYSR